MSDDQPTVSLLVYLHADRLIPKHSRLTGSTSIPCGDHQVQTEALAILLLSSAFWSLRQHGLIDIEVVDDPHAGWILHHDEVRVVRLGQALRAGLEGAIIDSLEGAESLRDVVCRWARHQSSDPWHDVVRTVVSEAVAGGYLREVEATRGVLARFLFGGSELEPDCRRIAGLRDQFEAFAVSWLRFGEQEGSLFDRLTQQCRRSLVAGAESWYA